MNSPDIMEKNIKTQIGIFVKIISQQDQVRLLKREKFYQTLFLASKKLNIEFFIFDVSDMLSDEMICAHFISRIKNKRNVWTQKTIPLPLVVWDQSLDTTYQQRQILLSQGVRFINPLEFAKIATDKLETYRTLLPFFNKENHIKQPETLAYSISNVSKLLGKYNYVFLKPQTGSQGKGIFSIKKTEDRLTLNLNQLITKKTLFKKIAQIIKDENYIAQQGIEVLTVNGAPFDIRVLVQRGGGKLIQINYASRIAGKNQIVANLNAGGLADSTLNVLKKNGWNKKNCRTLDEKIKKISLELHQFLEKNILQPIMEFALDLVIGKNQQIYLLEINASPGRNIFQTIDPKASKLAFNFPLKYIKYTLNSTQK